VFTPNPKQAAHQESDFCLGKPLRIVELLDTVARLLRLRSANSAD
jgi:hypothetical protein